MNAIHVSCFFPLIEFLFYLIFGQLFSLSTPISKCWFYRFSFPASVKDAKTEKISVLLWSWRLAFHELSLNVSDTVSRCRQCKSAVLHVNATFFFLCSTSIMEFVFSEITFTVVNNFQVEFFINDADFIQICRHIGMFVALAMNVRIQLYATFNANLVRILNQHILNVFKSVVVWLIFLLIHFSLTGFFLPIIPAATVADVVFYKCLYCLKIL